MPQQKSAGGLSKGKLYEQLLHSIDEVIQPGIIPPREHKPASPEIECMELHLVDYVREAWKIVEPATPYLHNWHIDAICEHLEAVLNGQIRNLLINMPPRSMKSLLVSVFWPTWAWIKKPQIRWLFSSYAQSLSTRDSIKCRRIIESPWYQRNWGDIYQLTGDQNTKTRFENNRTGYRIATSVEGSATGEGGDIVVVDDPHNVNEAESDTVRKATLLWWDQVMSTRLNDEKTGAKVIVMQRVHEKDLSGHVLAQGGYEHLCLPEEYEPDRAKVTCIGWRDPRKKKGELLWPEKRGPEEVANKKITLGSYGYAGQYQQRPAPASGGLFKKSYFRYFTEDGEYYVLLRPDGQGHIRFEKRSCLVFQTIDPAATEKQSSDYFVCDTWAITPAKDLLLLDVFREKAETTKHKAIMLTEYQRWAPVFQGVENKVYGLNIIQEMVLLGYPIKPLNADTDKVSRALPVIARYEVGKVYHRQEAPWLNDREAELLSFPKGAHDDQVDTTSYAGLILVELSVAQEPHDEIYDNPEYDVHIG